MNQTGFRILVLNTNLYYDQNKLTQNMEDPADQYRWSDEVLTKAANDKEKATHPILSYNWNLANFKSYINLALLGESSTGF